jgi:hypothetical protein
MRVRPWGVKVDFALPREASRVKEGGWRWSSHFHICRHRITSPPHLDDGCRDIIYIYVTLPYPAVAAVQHGKHEPLTTRVKYFRWVRKASVITSTWRLLRFTSWKCGTFVACGTLHPRRFHADEQLRARSLSRFDTRSSDEYQQILLPWIANDTYVFFPSSIGTSVLLIFQVSSPPTIHRQERESQRLPPCQHWVFFLMRASGWGNLFRLSGDPVSASNNIDPGDFLPPTPPPRCTNAVDNQQPGVSPASSKIHELLRLPSFPKSV